MVVILGILSGFSDALKNAIAKRNTIEFDELIVTWAWLFFAALFMLPLLLVSGIPQLNGTFWIALILVTVIDFISYYLYTLAIKASDLSLTLPMLAFTPLFVLISSIFINNELPRLLGVIGILLVVSGAYILNYRKSAEGKARLIDPILNVINNKGTLYMLIVALIWGLAGSLHKLAITNAENNSVFYAVVGVVAVAICYTVAVAVRKPKLAVSALRWQNLRLLAPVGFLEGVTVLTQMLTQGAALASFAISLKRTSIIFSAILGWKFFGEDIRQRLLPIILIVIGVILIAIQ